MTGHYYNLYLDAVERLIPLLDPEGEPAEVAALCRLVAEMDALLDKAQELTAPELRRFYHPVTEETAEMAEESPGRKRPEGDLPGPGAVPPARKLAGQRILDRGEGGADFS